MVTTRPAPPSEDKRWKIVDATMRRQGYSPTALIEALHTAQESFGFLDDDALRYVSRSLDVPLSKTFGVASFYHYFRLKPAGRHSCVVCTGTACYMKGSGGILKAIEAEAGVAPGETTAGGEMSLLIARCIGACSLAPAVVLDGEVNARQTPEGILQKTRAWFSHDDA